MYNLRFITISHYIQKASFTSAILFFFGCYQSYSNLKVDEQNIDFLIERGKLMSKTVTDVSANMDKNIQSLQKDLLKVRTGRASASLIDHVHVDYYGSKTPISV